MATARPLVKLWLDDVRNPPDSSWNWVKTAQDAINFLQYHHVDLISLDFDLGPVETCGTGLDVARYIVEFVDKTLFAAAIHSQNPVGAAQMRAVLLEGGVNPL